MVQYYFDPKILTDTQMDNITSKIAKFSQNNDNDACVLWTRSCNGSGYPQLRLGKELEKYFGDRCYNPGHILFSLHHNRILTEHVVIFGQTKIINCLWTCVVVVHHGYLVTAWSCVISRIFYTHNSFPIRLQTVNLLVNFWFTHELHLLKHLFHSNKLCLHQL